MTIFVVFRVKASACMRAAIARVYPNDSFDLGNNEWLISAEGTPKTVSDSLGITSHPDTIGAAIIFKVEGYSGRASPDIWNWIKSKSHTVRD
jgi:hypothetical protein